MYHRRIGNNSFLINGWNYQEFMKLHYKLDAKMALLKNLVDCHVIGLDQARTCFLLNLQIFFLKYKIKQEIWVGPPRPPYHEAPSSLTKLPSLLSLVGLKELEFSSLQWSPLFCFLPCITTIVSHFFSTHDFNDNEHDEGDLKGVTFSPKKLGWELKFLVMTMQQMSLLLFC